MKIKICSDSTCDLSPALIEKNQITIAPLTVSMGAGSYHDGVDITPEAIFAHVDGGGALCSTAAVSIGEYTDLFSRFTSDYDAVFHITISSDMSACYQNACLAAQEFSNVYVVDSRNLSTGHGLVVLEACRLAETCTDPRAMRKELQAFTARVEASFLLGRLDYMVKGGRCSTVMALGANLLHLKPCIEVIDGQMQVVKKYRGPMSRCLDNYVKDRLEGRKGKLVPGRIFVTHTKMEDGLVSLVIEEVKSYGIFDEITETIAGCTVTCHCGQGTLGILFVRDEG